MKESYVEGVASHNGPESCESTREGAVEALTGVRTDRVPTIAFATNALKVIIHDTALLGSSRPPSYLACHLFPDDNGQPPLMFLIKSRVGMSKFQRQFCAPHCQQPFPVFERLATGAAYVCPCHLIARPHIEYLNTFQVDGGTTTISY